MPMKKSKRVRQRTAKAARAALAAARVAKRAAQCAWTSVYSVGEHCAQYDLLRMKAKLLMGAFPNAFFMEMYTLLMHLFHAGACSVCIVRRADVAVPQVDPDMWIYELTRDELAECAASEKALRLVDESQRVVVLQFAGAWPDPCYAKGKRVTHARYAREIMYHVCL